MDRATEVNWEVTYTTDGESWTKELFELVDDARGYATEVIAENKGKPRFQMYVRRMVVVNFHDFLDRDIPGGLVRVL